MPRTLSSQPAPPLHQSPGESRGETGGQKEENKGGVESKDKNKKL